MPDHRSTKEEDILPIRKSGLRARGKAAKIKKNDNGR